MKCFKIKLSDFIKMSSIKIYKSYPKCNGKTRFGIRTTGGNCYPVWAFTSNEAFELAYGRSDWSNEEVA